jgi:aldehyde:ferredoxin oxidoreductase
MSGERFLGALVWGPVMGSKNVKAFVARGGAYKIVMSDQKKYQALQKKAIGRINAMNSLENISQFWNCIEYKVL